VSKKDKEITEKKPAKDAPKKDREGRTLTAERVKAKARKDAPEKTSVVLEVQGITVEADDDDGAGLARAMSTLAAMVSDG